MAEIDYQQAARRFGYGPRLDAKQINARDVLLDELKGGSIPLQGQGLVTSSEAVIAYETYRANTVAARRRVTEKSPPEMSDSERESTFGKPAAMDAKMPIVSPRYLAEIGARQRRVRSVQIGFVERLVEFWANHFSVSLFKRGDVGILAGPYEREAIRPHVLGKFSDMLLAVVQHPAMLAYLDNARSIGPASKVGRGKSRGLNENLAREIMELHTLGVDGGYTQADVTAFACVLTGWTYERKMPGAGAFVFRPDWHEPGAQTILAQAYTEPGVEQGVAVLRDIARRPQTAKHIARKLAMSFVSDDPPAALVQRLEAEFVRSGGDLGRLARVLIEAEESWTSPIEKLITPQEFLWSALRCLDVELEPKLVVRVLRQLGQQPWAPPSPAGYSYQSSYWLSADGMVSRLELADIIAARAQVDRPVEVANLVIGPSITLPTQETIQGADSVAQALALLLMSPEFLRR